MHPREGMGKTLATLREAAAGCRACDPYKRGTQTVFGEGRAHAKMMLVGEQPGHEEDLAGRPSSVRPASCSTARWRPRGSTAATST
jgi:DNA polymerase